MGLKICRDENSCSFTPTGQETVNNRTSEEKEVLAMSESFYMTNRHKLLLMVEELHKDGYGKLRVVPSVLPSGVYWRCSFVASPKRVELMVSQWIVDVEARSVNGEVVLSPKELADMFIEENGEFIELCKGKDEMYRRWYSGMLAQLEGDELPYAFADYFSPSGFWKTSKGKEIETLVGEEGYYFGNRGID